MNRPALLTATALLAMASAAQAGPDYSLETDLTLEGRYFPQRAQFPNQDNGGVSLSVQPEFYAEWRRGDYSLTATPFGRYDATDEERSHVDLRELHAQAVYDDAEIRAGISRVFWGRTELLHLVDIINQDDAVENIDGEDKLGQPMLRFGYFTRPANIYAYLLPYFRERTFAGPEGRLRPPLPVNTDKPRYADGDKQQHLDYALRLQGYAGGLDWGLAWFSGTAREPQLLPGNFVNTPQGPQPTELQPFYGLLDQASVDAQYTFDAWLFKLEAVWREQDVARLNPDLSLALQRDEYGAATGGFEYTRYGIFDTAWDLGLLAEYLWDERNEAAFQNDLFLGSRLAANDVAGSSLLGGVVVDLDHGSLFGSIEASRRLGGSSKLALELRLFSNIDAADTSFSAVSRDDHLQLTYSYYL